MLLAEFISGAAESLTGLYPKEEARSVVLLLCSSLLGTQSYTHIVEPATEVDPRKEEYLEKAMERLKKGEPVQYVLGKADFYGLTFRVTPDTLIPRPETEMLARLAMDVAGREIRMRQAFGKKASPVRVLDLCTGSGCVAWKIALAVPGVQVVGVDISRPALDVARSQNFDKELREADATAPQFVEADVLDVEHFPDLGQFDIITSNPPYIMESEKKDMRINVLGYEPASALFVPDNDPLIFYKKIAELSNKHLAKGGVGFAEINELLGPQTQALFSEAGFGTSSVIRDFYDKNRFVTYR